MLPSRLSVLFDEPFHWTLPRNYLMTAPFDFTGHFGGFVFTDAGKRRLLLRQDDGDRVLKVPRILRRRIIGKFRSGDTIRVAGTEEKDAESGVLKLVVSRVLPAAGDFSSASGLPPVSAAPVVLRVCSKKNCWRNGGRELFDALGRAVAAGGHARQIELRQVGCLDRCKQAPNVDGGGSEFSRCSPAEAGRLIERAANRSLHGEAAR